MACIFTAPRRRNKATQEQKKVGVLEAQGLILDVQMRPNAPQAPQNGVVVIVVVVSAPEQRNKGTQEHKNTGT